MGNMGELVGADRICVFDYDFQKQSASATNEWTRDGVASVIAVCDNGCGMPREVQDRIFEPFFTTKGVGRGTGLGLATAYGIVKQNDGFITVHSEPGQGTTIRIYLRQHHGPAARVESPGEAALSIGHGETVLLVEDEPAVLTVTESMLEKLGFKVLSAATPSQALAIAMAHSEEIQLLVTDVIMPEMNGRDLSERLMTQRPGLRCLYLSGYTADVIGPHGMLDPGVNFLPKPISLQSLSAKLREVLAAPLSYERTTIDLPLHRQ